MAVAELKDPAFAGSRTSNEPDPSEATQRGSQRRVLIHLGLHRTGTTYLQRRVFPRLAGVRYAQKPSRAQIERLGVERDDPRPLLISHEGLLARKRDGVVRRNRMARLVELFPDAVPVLTLRRHDRWVRSLYVYNVYKGERRSFETFVREREPLTLMPYVRLLATIFSRPPYVLFQEELSEVPEAASELLAHWAGGMMKPGERRHSRVNRGLNDKGLRWVLRMNRCFPRGENAPPSYRWAQKLTRHLGAMMLSRAGASVPDRLAGVPVLDERTMQEVRNRYRADWIALLRWTASQRQLLAPSVRDELQDARSDELPPFIARRRMSVHGMSWSERIS